MWWLLDGAFGEVSRVHDKVHDVDMGGWGWMG